MTRSEPGARETADRLAAQSFQPIIAPMLTIEPTGKALPPLERAQGLVFTSANGVRFFGRKSNRRDLTAWCVGPATTDAAFAAGFEEVHNADGNAQTLADVIADQADPYAGTLVHVANEAAAGRLLAQLEAIGFDTEFAPLYRTRPAHILPKAVSSALQAEEPCLVMVHSAKGASAFERFARRHDVGRHALVAVSNQAAAPLEDRGFAITVIAEAPNENAILKAAEKARAML